MPSLKPLTWTKEHPIVPYVWSCADCDAAFDMGPIHNGAPTTEQINQVNAQFKAHCTQVHSARGLIIGLRHPDHAT
jgi:hypothetical protein